MTETIFWSNSARWETWVVLLFPNVSGEYQYICQCGVIDGLLQLWFPRQTRALCSQSGCCGGPCTRFFLWQDLSKKPSSSHGSWAPDGVRSALSHTTVIFKAFRIAIHRCIHPVLLFCFVLIHNGILQCGPKRLGSTPFQLGAVCFDRSSLNERFQNKAAYPGGKLRAVSTTSIRGLCTNCPLKAINGS